MKVTFKISVLAIVLLSMGKGAYAQATLLKEWFGQKRTQREYLLNQIAALQVYIGYAKKGYQIYDKGLNMIGSFKNGEFDLHDDFFLLLKGINPEIARYAKVAATIQLQYKVLQTSSHTMRMIRASDPGSNRIGYVNDVFGKVIADSEGLLEDLLTLTTASGLELTDDERLERIDKLHHDMTERSRFASQFSEEVLFIERSRSAEQRHIEFNKHLNNK